MSEHGVDVSHILFAMQAEDPDLMVYTGRVKTWRKVLHPELWRAIDANLVPLLISHMPFRLPGSDSPVVGARLVTPDDEVNYRRISDLVIARYLLRLDRASGKVRVRNFRQTFLRWLMGHLRRLAQALKLDVAASTRDSLVQEGESHHV